MNGSAGIKLCALALALASGCSVPAAGEETNAAAPAPVTARDFYNSGTQLLDAKKFAKAETMFQSALAAQDGRVRPAALYNLGQARFGDGVETLKKGPSAGSVATRENMAETAGNQAVQRAQSALAHNDVAQMVAAYLEGRGARRNVAGAEKAVRQAMETYGATLHNWRRAADDFKSAAELNPADTNAAQNAVIVEQYIARLVDSLSRVQRMAAMLGGRRSQLNGLLDQLRGRIPKGALPPGAGGDSDEDGGIQPESLRGLKEGATREGKEIEVPISPDEAAQILDGMTPGGDRLLPMNEAKKGRTPEKTTRTW